MGLSLLSEQDQFPYVIIETVLVPPDEWADPAIASHSWISGHYCYRHCRYLCHAGMNNHPLNNDDPSIEHLKQASPTQPFTVKSEEKAIADALKQVLELPLNMSTRQVTNT